jgi:hypothetical protein
MPSTRHIVTIAWSARCALAASGSLARWVPMALKAPAAGAASTPPAAASRRRRLSSSRSAVVSPSSRRPSSRSACSTQLRIDCAVGSNCRDRSSGVATRSHQLDHLPPELRRVRRSRLRHRGLLLRKDEVSTETGQLQSTDYACGSFGAACRIPWTFASSFVGVLAMR